MGQPAKPKMEKSKKHVGGKIGRIASDIVPGLELPVEVRGSTPQLSFQPPYSLLFFNCHDFSRALAALLTLPVIF